MLTFARVCVLCIPMEMVRIRKPINVPFDPELLAALDEWIEGQLPLKVSRASVIEAAVAEWLAAKKRERRK